MKQAVDSTVDLFPGIKKRGRPATGKAKTSAQRQADYRRNKGRSGETGSYNLNVWVSIEAKFVLRRLSAHYGIDRVSMLERLLTEAEDKALSKLDHDSNWGDYFES